MGLRLTATDAWILVAIGGRGERVDLSHLLFSADYVNRLIPTRMELEDAINHLGKAGLVTVTEHGFALTPAGSKILADRGAGSIGVITLMLGLTKEWDHGAEVELVNPEFTYSLDSRDYDAAL